MNLFDGLVSYWKFDEASGNAADSYGTNTLTNNSSVGFTTGKLNNGGNFVAASTDSFSISDASQSGLDITGDITISLWVNLASQPGSGLSYSFISKFLSAGNQRSYSVRYFNSAGTLKVVFLANNDGTSSEDYAFTQTLSNSTWYHVVMAWKASTSTCSCFINGAKQTDIVGTKTSLFNGTADFVIGSNANYAGDWTDGVIDEVGIWNRRINDDEIVKIYNAGNVLGLGSFRVGSFGKYLGSGSGTTFLNLHLDGSSADASGNNNSGTDTTITYGAANGRFTQGALFNGTSSKFTVPYTSYPTGNITISFWIKHSGDFTTTGECILSCSTSSDANGFDIYGTTYSSLKRFSIDWYTTAGHLIGDFQWNYGITNLVDGKWHNIINTLNYTTKASLTYLDGNQVSSGTLTASPTYTTQVLSFGRAADNYFNFLNGSLDEIIIDSVVWSPSQIRRYYSQAVGRLAAI